jgi:hypothetical protein
MASATKSQVNGKKSQLADPAPISLPYPQGNEVVTVKWGDTVTWTCTSPFYVTLIQWPDDATVSGWSSDWQQHQLQTETLASSSTNPTVQYTFTKPTPPPKSRQRFLCVYNNQTSHGAGSASRWDATPQPPPPPPNIIIIDPSN